MIRQGDIWIEDVGEIPADAVRVQPVNGRYVVAEGEATGHAHTIEATPDVEMYERDGVLYCRVLGGGATIVHQEHAAQVLTPSIKRIVRQRVWDSANAARVVAD